MNLFDLDVLKAFPQQRFAFLAIAENDHVLTITLDRPAKKNALHPKMIHELAYAFQYAHDHSGIWMIVITALKIDFCHCDQIPIGLA